MRTKGLMRFFSILAALALWSTSAMATVVLDFRTGECTAAGSIDFDGTDVSGSDIAICALEVSGLGGADGVYTADATLTFDTGDSSLSITGTVDGLIIGPPVTLLSGTIGWFEYSNHGSNASFEASGEDTKGDELLKALSISQDVAWEFYGFTIEAANGKVISTDIVNTAVPVPAAVWLFGSGLIGLAGVARRRKAA